MAILTTLAGFNSPGNSAAGPAATLVEDAAGDLFGTTVGGGPQNLGTVFEIPFSGGSYAGTPTTLVYFNLDGGAPYGGLLRV